jgi:hypothetical protein
VAQSDPLQHLTQIAGALKHQPGELQAARNGLKEQRCGSSS